MKSAQDPRHIIRRQTVKELFAVTYTPQKVSQTTQEILDHAKEIDAIIGAAAPQWPVDKLNKIDLAVLRLAVFELTFKKTPEKVVIDEAVELAKEFGSESSGPFVNGVLGNIATHKTANDPSKERNQ